MAKYPDSDIREDLRHDLAGLQGMQDHCKIVHIISYSSNVLK